MITIPRTTGLVNKSDTILIKILVYFSQGVGFTLADCLFGVVKLTENGDTANYGYSACGVRFAKSSLFSLSNDKGFGKIVIIFGADNLSLVNVNNRTKIN